MAPHVVTGIVEFPDGNGAPCVGARVSATLYAGDSPIAFGTSGDMPVGSVATLTGSTGSWSLRLEPNSNINPAGTVWAISVAPPGRASSVFFVEVPSAGSSHVAADILAEQPGALPSKALDAHAALTGAHGSARRSLLDVRDYGAVTGGDITAALAACESAVSAGRGPGIYVPNGTWYYSGPGLELPAPFWAFVGDGPGLTTIDLSGASGYLFDTSQKETSFLISGVRTVNGKGLYRSKFYGSNGGTYHKTIENCTIKNYTECGVQWQGYDFPAWRVDNVNFEPATDDTIGLACGKFSQNTVIERCSFRGGRAMIKLVDGTNVTIRDCDFSRFLSAPTVDRAQVWVVPASPMVDGGSGNGLVIENNKFSIENYDPDHDYVIVFADEGAGSYNGNRKPVLDTESYGSISGVKVIANKVTGSGAESDRRAPVIFSTTGAVSGLAVAHNDFSQSLPRYLIEYLNPAWSAVDAMNTFGPNSSRTPGLAYGPSGLAVSNAPAAGYLIDPTGQFSVVPHKPHTWPGAQDLVGYVPLSVGGAFSAGGSAALSPTTDALGGGDAFSAAVSSPTDYAARTWQGAAMAKDLPIWIEFDAKSSASDELVVAVEGSSGSPIIFRRYVGLLSTWHRYRFMFWCNNPAASATWRVKFRQREGHVSSPFEVGRVMVYQHRQPANPREIVLVGDDGMKYRVHVVDGALTVSAVA